MPILHQKVRNVPVADVQADEIWTFCKKKESHKFPFEAHDDAIGDAWCLIGIERRSKLALAFDVGGKRDNVATNAFMKKLAVATSSDYHFQLTTDAMPRYSNAVYRHFGERVSYGQVIKP